MTDRIAIWLALIVIAVFAVDAFAFDGQLPVFLGKKMADLLEWIAFWR